MEEHLAGALLRRVVAFHDVGPQQARGADLGHLHEIVGGDIQREAELAGRFVDGQSRVLKTHEVVVAGGEGEGELFDDRRTGVAEDVPRDGYHADVFIAGGPADQVGDASEALFAVGRAEGALLGEPLHERVDAERDVRFFLGDALFFEFGQYELGHVGHTVAREDEFYGRNADLAEQFVQIGCRERLSGDAEAERVDAGIEEFERLFVGRFRALDLHGLMHVPAVVRVRTADERELPCPGAHEADTLEVLGAVVGAHVESLARLPYQFALVVSTFQVGRNHLFPFLRRDGRELGEQLFTFGICHNYIEISI